jgi:hypothetical protein
MIARLLSLVPCALKSTLPSVTLIVTGIFLKLFHVFPKGPWTVIIGLLYATVTHSGISNSVASLSI